MTERAYLKLAPPLPETNPIFEAAVPKATQNTKFNKHHVLIFQERIAVTIILISKGQP